MTDGPQGHGWWQASDLKWYPPELRPAYMAALPPPPTADAAQSQPVDSAMAAFTATRPAACAHPRRGFPMIGIDAWGRPVALVCARDDKGRPPSTLRCVVASKPVHQPAMMSY